VGGATRTASRGPAPAPPRSKSAVTRGPQSKARAALPVGAALALAPLPETASELREVARRVGAGEASLRLGAEASEAKLKQAALDQYRIVYFATHGLVADEVGGLAEPALALTPPAVPSALDDGLLMASEVAQLKLNADWVVLSACNTAAGAKSGAEALSGLARAFFYAGARALLVSHWRVYSEAALKLSGALFGELTVESGIGRDEALRRSMLALIEKGSVDEVQPAYWAPFVLVGVGGRS
jgi:CHAT domain-containing protein